MEKRKVVEEVNEKSVYKYSIVFVRDETQI